MPVFQFHKCFHSVISRKKIERILALVNNYNVYYIAICIIMFISIIITARYWRARGSCVVAVMRRATSLKNTRSSVSKVQRIVRLLLNF